MAKKFKSGKCAHCQTFSKKPTSDHVFPKSWYPATTPKFMEKWQMPSCTRCNEKYGKIENELLIKFGLSVDPHDYNSLGISDKALRALNPIYAKNEKDRIARIKKREQIKNEIFKFDPTHTKSILPGFGIENYPYSIQPQAIGIDHDNLIAVCEKIIRGAQYALWKKLIPKDKKLEIFFIQDEKSQPFSEMVAKYGSRHHRGPGINLGIAIPYDDAEQAMYEIIIWGRFKYYGMIINKE